MDWTAVASFATGGGLSAVFSVWNERRKTNSAVDRDAVATAAELNDIAIALIEPLAARVAAVEAEVSTVRGLLREAATILRDFIEERKTRNEPVPPMSAALRQEVERTLP
ncbi:hypothetical protein [Rhodococcus opacus]|uniref:Uncharacterized protein n=1 Tax=Rhodococcus opacus TaxID=37919 RepID=A0A2S8JB04_RHOOP|nr:hypothetical protein [Rhodococcus opacus]PQP24175.1 hypothetical protein C5613_14945 [Rhodococcus opacus]